MTNHPNRQEQPLCSVCCFFFLLAHLSVMSCISHGWQKVKGLQIIVSPDLSSEHYPTCTAYIDSGRAWVSVHIYERVHELTRHHHPSSPKTLPTIIRMPKLLPFISPGKTSEFTKIYLPKVTRASPAHRLLLFIQLSSSPAPVLHQLPPPVCLSVNISLVSRVSFERGSVNFLSEFSASFGEEEGVSV